MEDRDPHDFPSLQGPESAKCWDAMVFDEVFHENPRAGREAPRAPRLPPSFCQLFDSQLILDLKQTLTPATPVLVSDPCDPHLSGDQTLSFSEFLYMPINRIRADMGRMSYSI